MTVQIKLNERHHKVLQATIKHYIATAEPVGSKTLMKEYDFSVSSATIRNAMGKLEKAGFLYQPYTSAGRIPSDSGYRVYVDQLLTEQNTVKISLDPFLDATWLNLSGRYEILFQKITKILAEVSGCIALITLPQVSGNIIRHLQLVRVADDKIMLVIVIDNYQAESFVLDSQELRSDSQKLHTEVFDSELEILSNFLNHKLKGKSLKEINHLDGGELDNDFKLYTDFINHLLIKIKSSYHLAQSTPILLQGFSQLVQQPEFSSIDQVKILLNFLETEQKQLLPLLFNINENLEEKRVKIHIGSENPLESMRSCSLISAYYFQEDYPVGSVGIIGPTRMPYEQAIALVECTANYLSEKM
ncbi:heat-inducible transcriptional repressor HrcA [Cyanobacterium sp. Dongsha4]|uniref:heat-inducible transcriptional repressor HrcA n=1 Tax=Cyanobacterium sp. DS4 TaxID=2878255 RepID=UPI002E812E4F|nr:heat-inducible transcriptional repressor HrcA [Cyanobacterium sp. Dongsha4]WVL01541.1 heat-inducible transcriptional repressor HrcA [Cyanobacterium sp. Dongsha4]